MELRAKQCILRPWRNGDQDSLVRHGNNPNVSRWLDERFPYPYTRDAADSWIAICESNPLHNGLAIVIDGQPVGGIGIVLREGILQKNASLGYWLGEAFWGRGIVPDAVSVFVPDAFERFGLARIEASVFPANRASCRVLERNGFILESTQRNGLYKNGVVYDRLLYARWTK